MSILDRFKKTAPPASGSSQEASAAEGQMQTEKKGAAASRALEGILCRPVITEKANNSGTYIFEVAPHANKISVKQAIRARYGVHPAHVRIMNVGGKRVRWQFREGKRSDWKKAIVRLRPGETITVHEGT